MTKILEWRLAEDQRDVVHLAVQALAEGHLVAFPTDTTYQIAANAMRPKAVDRLVSMDKKKDDQPIEIVLRSALEVQDYVPYLSAVAKRLAWRSWPGPLSLQMKCNDPYSLLRQLPGASQEAVSVAGGGLTMRVPAHDAITQVLHLSAGPMLIRGGVTMTGEDATSVRQMKLDGVTLAIDDGSSHFQNCSTLVRVDGNMCRTVRPGVLDKSALIAMTQLVILLVCTGNTCRSPMAQALLQKKLKQRFGEKMESHASPIMVMSAGIAASAGCAASPEAVEAMQDFGLDLGNHESSNVSSRLMERADIILTMTEGHRRALIERWPKAAGKIKVLSADGDDISDPFGGPVEVYRICAQQLDRCLDAWVDKIKDEMLPNWQS